MDSMHAQGQHPPILILTVLSRVSRTAIQQKAIAESAIVQAPHAHTQPATVDIILHGLTVVSGGK